MDGTRFDTITRSLTVAGSRRRALAAAVGGVLGLLGHARPEDIAAGGKCKPKCDECETCKKGKHGKKGKCKPKGNGSSCGPCRTCESGKCTGVRPTNTTCNGDGKCYAGECAARPTCLANASICPAATPCCGDCNTVVGLCKLSATGQECYGTENCAVGIGLTCQGYRCR